MTTRSPYRTIRLDDFASFAPMSVAAVGLAVTALLGRAATVLVPGSSTTGQLVVLLSIALGALVCARAAVGHTSGDRAASGERRLVRLATRIATVQVIVGCALLMV